MKPNIDVLFKAVGDPTRREIFHVLVVAAAAMPINHISEKFNMTRQGVTKHIKMLQEAGLVTIEKKGRERFCHAHPTSLREISTWINYYEQFWEDKLDKLGKHLDA